MANTNGNGAMVVPNKTKTGFLKSFLDSSAAKTRLAAVAKDFLKPDDLVRLALVAVHRNPQLLECSPESVLSALMDAAELKIKPGGLQGRGYLIPRYNKNTKRKECTFDPGWRGLIDIMRRSGGVARVEAHPVYEIERPNFVVRFGTYSVIEHTPYLGHEDPGEIIAAYAVAFFKDGSYQGEVLTARDLAKIRAASQSTSGPWEAWGGEMCRKSAVRRLYKYMPSSDQLEKAARLAAKADGGDDVDWDFDVVPDAIVDGDGALQDAPSLTQSPSRAESLKERLASRIEQPVPVPARRDDDGRDDQAAEEHFRGREPGDD